MTKQEVYMLSKYGDVYPGIVRYGTQMHPNPGVKEDDYDEILNTIDWIVSVEKSSRGVNLSRDYLIGEISRYTQENGLPDSGIDFLENGLYEDSDLYSSDLIEFLDNLISDSINENDISDSEISKMKESVANYVNQAYLRVRVGGKYDTQTRVTSFSGPEDAIYFRISSREYDWRSTIVDFLWEYFGSEIYKTRTVIWVGHDAETNPPETTIFKGTPSELEEFSDAKRFESYSVSKSVSKKSLYNRDRALQVSTRSYKRVFDPKEKFV